MIFYRYNLHFTFVERIVNENNKTDTVITLNDSQFSIQIISSITQIRDAIALLSNEMLLSTGIDQIKIASDNIRRLTSQHEQNPRAKEIPACLKEFAELCCGLCNAYDSSHMCRAADYDNIYQQVDLLMTTMQIYAQG